MRNQFLQIAIGITMSRNWTGAQPKPFDRGFPENIKTHKLI